MARTRNFNRHTRFTPGSHLLQIRAAWDQKPADETLEQVLGDEPVRPRMHVSHAELF